MLTIPEAAALVGVTEHTIRQWVYRKHLAPVRRGAKPLLFREADVIECAHARISKARHAHLDDLWDKITNQGCIE